MVFCIAQLESLITVYHISLIKAFTVCLGFLSRDTIEFSKEFLMKDLLHFHYHYRHYNNKLMIRSCECTSDSHPHRHTYTDVVPGGNLWKHAPDYLDLMCEQRFGSPLFGLVSHEVPKRNGSNMTSSGRTKDRVKQKR